MIMIIDIDCGIITLISDNNNDNDSNNDNNNDNDNLMLVVGLPAVVGANRGHTERPHPQQSYSINFTRNRVY